MSNRIDSVRPTSTFDNFQPQNEDQEKVRDGLKKLAYAVKAKIEKGGMLDHAKLVNLHGAPGRGKTHLVEAFLNVVKPDANDFTRKSSVCLLDGGKLASWEYGSLDDVRVLAIDDLFRGQQSLSSVSATDIKSVMEGLYRAYERRQFVLTTSNFPTNGMIDLIKAQDTVGRLRSRLAEMSIGAIELTGEDYREKLARERAERGEDPFSL